MQIVDGSAREFSKCQEQILGAVGHRKNISLDLKSQKKFWGKGGRERGTSQA